MLVSEAILFIMEDNGVYIICYISHKLEWRKQFIGREQQSLE